MNPDHSHRTDIATLLETAESGDAASLDRLVPLLYDELRAMAHRQLEREHGPRTLRTTALVHEAYLRLAGNTRVAGRGRAYFFAAASRAMRQVLVDRARARGAQKRGGDSAPVTLMDGHVAIEVDPVRMLALHQAIEELEPRQRQVVEARFFGGMEEREIAELLGVSERTVRREWVKARAWLVRALVPSGEEAPAGE
jgi:RNA polymerase sigma-70 factor, ECF subfamily